ncbi:hypothetical protein GSY74_01245, partial [Sulfurovum sp. bin170]|uniref:hypothetical protein n=1 Tax=Sulfurovum sp. bin170 TaxID=2695268 RepID=UPI0013E02F8B
NSKIDELSEYKNSLKQKCSKLSEIDKVYKNLYEQIPRYYELQEENLMSLLAPPVKQKMFSWS